MLTSQLHFKLKGKKISLYDSIEEKIVLLLFMKISRGMEYEFSCQNSKIKKVCPRCMKSDLAIQTRLNSGLYKYYRNLSKNLRYFIQRQSIARVKVSPKRSNLKDFLMKKNVRFKKSKVRNGEAVICKVEDFEDDDKDNKEVIDYNLYMRIESTVVNMDVDDEIKLQDVVGNGFLKEVIDRTIIWPMKRPDVFKGLRRVPKGVLLFGPSGTGITLIGRCIAFQTDWTFFNIPSSLLKSRWSGESERLVRTMFAVAKARQPSLIFIDEIDSILSQRNLNEDVGDSGRRLRNEFLENMDGRGNEEQDQIMIIGATNRPQELDEAVRQRFIIRLYIPFPDETAREELLTKLLENECHCLIEEDINEIISKTEGYSFTDIKSLCREAAMGPIKSLSANSIFHLNREKIRPITLEDFLVALQLIKPSVTTEELEDYEIWNSKYGYSNQNYKKRSKEREKAMSVYINDPYII